MKTTSQTSSMKTVNYIKSCFHRKDRRKFTKNATNLFWKILAFQILVLRVVE